MTPPTNTYTVTFTDQHSHSVLYSAIVGGGGNTMQGKMDALRNAMNQAADQAANVLGAFTAGDTLTITVTQP